MNGCFYFFEGQNFKGRGIITLEEKEGLQRQIVFTQQVEQVKRIYYKIAELKNVKCKVWNSDVRGFKNAQKTRTSFMNVP